MAELEFLKFHAFQNVWLWNAVYHVVVYYCEIFNSQCLGPSFRQDLCCVALGLSRFQEDVCIFLPPLDYLGAH